MKIQVKRTINAPVEAIWAYLGDYSNIHRFHPMLKGSHFTEGTATCEVGATRQCDFNDGNYIQERVLEWEEGSHYTVDIYDSSMPVKSAQATLGVRPLGEDQTEAYMHMEMTPKNSLMSPMMYLMYKFNIAPGVLKGLEKLYLSESQLNVAKA